MEYLTIHVLVGVNECMPAEQGTLAHTLRETARRTGIPFTTLQSPKYRRRIGLPVTRIGRRVLVLESDLLELLRRGRERSSSRN